MTVEISERWLNPVSDTDPSGPSVEYDPRFIAVVGSARRKEEQQLGASVLPAQEPDWHTVLNASAELLDESRDLRLLIIWSYASFKTSGLKGLSVGIEILATLLERQWSTLHPVLESDGDWYVRINAIAALADPDSLLRALRDSEITTTLGVISVRDACLLSDGQPLPNCPFSSTEQLALALKEDAAQRQQLATLCTAILDALSSIDKVVLSHIGHDALPPLAPLKRIIESMRAIYQPAIESSSTYIPESAEVALPNPAIPGAPPIASTASARSDALRALSFAREYFERHEPSHPAALMIRRVERLATSTFIDIIAELAPDSLAHVKTLTGLDQS